MLHSCHVTSQKGTDNKPTCIQKQTAKYSHMAAKDLCKGVTGIIKLLTPCTCSLSSKMENKGVYTK